jgi:TFIIF-interacting CTD phosphatase-like protein
LEDVKLHLSHSSKQEIKDETMLVIECSQFHLHRAAMHMMYTQTKYNDNDNEKETKIPFHSEKIRKICYITNEMRVIVRMCSNADIRLCLSVPNFINQDYLLFGFPNIKIYDV